MIDHIAELPTLTCDTLWGNAFEGEITLHSAMIRLHEEKF